MTVSKPTFRHLHSLYWLIANLADDAPVAVVIDDAQWADAPSARFLSFLAPRLAHLCVAVILAARPEAPEIAPLLLTPLARVLRPGPLSPAAVAEWLSGALQSPAAEVFARACWEATGGNPFLPRELVREIALEGIVPDATQAPRVRSLSPRGVATGQQRSRHLRHAVDTLEDSGARLEYARALVTLGIDRRQRGRAVSARHLLRSGHDLAVRCQADRLAQAAHAELRLAGARPRRNAFTGPRSLTPGERRMVDLVASGMSNRQVGQALFVTEKTVETDLGHVYAKLGIRSRRELVPILAAELAAYHETGELGDA